MKKTLRAQLAEALKAYDEKLNQLGATEAKLLAAERAHAQARVDAKAFENRANDNARACAQREEEIRGLKREIESRDRTIEHERRMGSTYHDDANDKREKLDEAQRQIASLERRLELAEQQSASLHRTNEDLGLTVERLDRYVTLAVSRGKAT